MKITNRVLGVNDHFSCSGETLKCQQSPKKKNSIPTPPSGNVYNNNTYRPTPCYRLYVVIVV